MTTDDIVKVPTLAEAMQRLYGPVVDRTLEEAAQFEGVDMEIALMRHWLLQTTTELPPEPDRPSMEHTQKLMMRMFTQIVRAVAVKYQLSPGRADLLSAAMIAVADHMDEAIKRADEEEDV